MDNRLVVPGIGDRRLHRIRSDASLSRVGCVRTPSVTINCATYVPATSIVKVGLTIFGLLRVALLPGALEWCSDSTDR